MKNKKESEMKKKEMVARIEELEKKLKEAESRYDLWYKANQKKEEQIKRIHAALDVFPFAHRTVEVKGQWGTDTVEVSVEGRVMAILGQAAGILNYQRKTDVSTTE